MREKVKQEWKKWTILTPDNALYDRSLIWLFIGFLAIGLMMVNSASMAEGSKNIQNIILALVFFVIGINIPSAFWEKWNVPIFVLALLLLILVLKFGGNVKGAVRWIKIGSVNFQPAELAKFAIICYFSSFYVRKFDEMRSEFLSSLRPMFILGLFVFLLMNQPDLGSSAVLFVLTFGMLFIMGARLLQFVLLALLGGGLFTYFVLSSDYRLRRVTSFLHPFDDYYGDGYQLANSQIAFAQGEIWGQGLGNSLQKLGRLPEIHTDFIMALVGEEFGLIGIIFIVFMLMALTFKALKISREALILEQRFRGFFAFGIGLWIFIQGFVNLGVASGLLPTKGLTFPFVSYGGSSIIVMVSAMAILVRIDHENRLERVGHATLKED